MKAKKDCMEAYYNRTMSSKLEGLLKKRDELQKFDGQYHWMIQYVKDHPELDFQTGSNRGTSWFSIYRGTGRVLKISSSGRVSADKEYIKLLPAFYNNPSPELFDELLSILSKSEKFFSYYAKEDLSERKEGYYQTLIARRYTFANKPTDEFIIIDKELVIGFDSSAVEKEWNKPLSIELGKRIAKARAALHPTKLPSEIKDKYGEFDFLGLNWDGDIIIMELKQDDPNKTYLSPAQACFYHLQFTKLYGEITSLYNDIYRMVKQKIDLGLLQIPNGRELPVKLSGKIKTYLIVGEDKTLSKEVCKRFRSFRNEILPDMEAYTCAEDGTLIRSIKLEGE